MGPIGSAESPFIFNDAIICLAQSLTEAVNQLSSGLRRARDLIEELGRRENFYLNLAGDSSGRAAGTIFHNTHLTYELPCANCAEKDALAIEFPEYLDATPDKTKNIVRGIPFSEEDFPFSEVLASHSISQSRTGGDSMSGNYHGNRLAVTPHICSASSTPPTRRRPRLRRWQSSKSAKICLVAL